MRRQVVQTTTTTASRPITEVRTIFSSRDMTLSLPVATTASVRVSSSPTSSGVTPSMASRQVFSSASSATEPDRSAATGPRSRFSIFVLAAQAEPSVNCCQRARSSSGRYGTTLVAAWNDCPATASRTSWRSSVLSLPEGQPRARIASEREIISFAQKRSTSG